MPAATKASSFLFSACKCSCPILAGRASSCKTKPMQGTVCWMGAARMVMDPSFSTSHVPSGIAWISLEPTSSPGPYGRSREEGS